MIHVDWATAPAKGHEDAAALVSSLRVAGIEAGLLAGSLPGTLGHTQACLLAHLLAPRAPQAGDRLLVLAGAALSDAHLADLRRLSGLGLAGCLVAGQFDNRQTEIGIAAKYGYALGQPPALLPLPAEDRGLLTSPIGPVFGVARPRSAAPEGLLRVLVVAPEIGPGGPQALQALATARRLQVTLLTDGETKAKLRAAGLGLPIYQYGEVPPAALVARVDAAVFCRPVPKSYPLRLMLADLAMSGVALLDASRGFANRARDPVFVPAPADPVALAIFLATEVRPDLVELQRHVLASQLVHQSTATLARLREGLVLPETVAPARRAARRTDPPPVVFLPTNGVGLGHAQRCAQVAGRLAAETGARPVFAAFPSCLRLIKAQGFDAMPLVQKTGLHAEGFANDLVNSQRLEGLLPDAAAFVFDGGYVFTSILRAVVEHRVPSLWLRRGLWQPGQDNSVALEREKIFQRIIVPEEAFEELNSAYSSGPHVTTVGPIVQETALAPDRRAALRQGLADRFGIEFRQLVVTMLGGGVAADRSAQTAAVAAALARRPDVLHLVVVWPTATVEPGLFTWPNTRVVRTHHAGVLMAASDLAVSAVGYNSFHEAMYARVPTVFVPQMAAFMDDQSARAKAAADRGVACLVEPHQMTTLSRTLDRLLDRGGIEALAAALRSLALPAPGTAAAAATIAQVAGLSLPQVQPARRIA
jgi:hypothetical protein